MDDVVDELRKAIAKGNPESADDILMMSRQYSPIVIDKKNFHAIISDDHPQCMLFVDGGNSIIFECPNFCLGYIRVAAIRYKNNVRQSKSSDEFYVLITENDSKFNVKTFPDSSFNGLIFDSDDETLRIGKEKCIISRIVSIIRRFCEIDYAYSQDSSDTDIIILDGTLEARYPYEQNYLNKLFLSGKACALSKTCSLTTKNGSSITRKLLALSNQLTLHDQLSSAWYYHPIVQNNNVEHKAEIYFTSLNPKSDYVFRFEIQQGFAKDIESLFSTLCKNSNDPVFLGYPYGFIDVDSNARISENELMMQKTRFAVKLGSEWSELSKNLSSMNAHDILDKMRF